MLQAGTGVIGVAESLEDFVAHLVRGVDVRPGADSRLRGKRHRVRDRLGGVRMRVFPRPDDVSEDVYGVPVAPVVLELSVHRHGLIERRLRHDLPPERSQKVAALLKRTYGIAA